MRSPPSVQSQCLSSISSAGRITPVAALWTKASSGPSARTCSSTRARADVAADQNRLGAERPAAPPRSPRPRGRCGGSRSRPAQLRPLREAERDRPPDAARAARDENGLALEGHAAGTAAGCVRGAPRSGSRPTRAVPATRSAASSAFDDAWPSRSSSSIFASPYRRAPGGPPAGLRSAAATRALSWYAKCGVAGPTSASTSSFVGSAIDARGRPTSQDARAPAGRRTPDRTGWRRPRSADLMRSRPFCSGRSTSSSRATC